MQLCAMPKKIVFLLFVFVPFVFQSFNSKDHNIELVVLDSRSTKGQIAIGIYKDDYGFQNSKSFLNKRFPKTEMKNGKLTVKFSLEPGIYGIALLDDESMDAKMDYNFIGIPKEGFGFSNYYHTGLTKPHFDKFKFEVKPNSQKKIEIKVRYL
jgi:uncharacterized protein (DUF2141 family)